MDKEQIQKALDELKKQSKKKFAQSYDLILNLRDIETKSNPVDVSVTLHYQRGKNIKVAAFVDQQLAEQATQHCSLVIKETEFNTYKDKKKLKRLAETYDYFIAQANLMPKVAAAFGKALGMKGKMPNPKLGCVVPPNTNLELLVKKLNMTVRVKSLKATNLQCMVGKESQPDAEIIDNIMTMYTAIVKQLPSEEHNIRSVNIKLTMGAPVKV